jgi:hypothetical protein
MTLSAVRSGLPIVAANFLRNSKPSLLKQILRFGRLSHEAQKVAIHAILIARDQCGKSVQIAAPKLQYLGFNAHSPLPDTRDRASHMHTTNRPA